jgi:hypothetical protein
LQIPVFHNAAGNMARDVHAAKAAGLNERNGLITRSFYPSSLALDCRAT